jgi:predicted transposase/invertase (TIGR01784 family)
MPEPGEKARSQLHDRFVKDFMQNPGDAAALIKHALPAAIAQKLSWAELRHESAEFIDEKLGLLHSDLLVSIPFGAVQLRLFLLFEHQSSVEVDAVIRAAGYKTACYLNQRKKGEIPGPVLCLIFYHGKEPWNAADNFADWLKLAPNDAFDLKFSMASKEYLLLDIAHVEIETLEASLRLKARLDLLKSIRNGTILDWLLRYIRFVDEWLNDDDEKSRTVTMIRYCLQASDLPISTFHHELNKLPYDRTMNTFKSTADQLIEEGWLQGEREGLQKGREVGFVAGRIQTLQQIGKLEQTPSEKLQSLSLDELRRILNQVEQQVFGAKKS